MDKEKIQDNYKEVLVKIIDYLTVQQSNNNTSELILNVEESINGMKVLDMKVDEIFKKYFNIWQDYFDYQALISNEFLDELKQNQIYDGILIADLKLCKKRVINENFNKEEFGCIRIDDVNGIYFEQKVNSK